LALATGLVVAIVAALAAPGFACDAIVTASSSCANGSQVITWTISSDRTDLEMDITHALAHIGVVPNATYYPTTGWASAVAPGGSTTATTVVPLGVTGTLQLDLYVFWPAILATQQPKVNGLSVALNNCATTTTSAAPTTSSTTSPTTTSTTYPQNTSTTYVASTSTTYPQSTSTTSTTYPQNTSTTYVESTSTTYPHNTSTTYVESTSTTYPHHSTTTTCAPTGNTHKKNHKRPHKSVNNQQANPKRSLSVWWPAPWFA
jgi:hypothetical protein